MTFGNPDFNSARDWRGLGFTVLFFFAALFYGVVSSIFSWWVSIGLVAVPALFVLAWIFPVASTGVVLALQFGVLSKIVPKIELGGGGLNPEDVAIPFLLIMYSIKYMSDIKNRICYLKPYFWPLICFIGCAIASVFFALIFKTAPSKDVFNEFRPFFTWLIFPLLFLTVGDRKEYGFFLKMVFALSVIVAIGMLVQSFSGYQIFEKGQEVRDLYTLGGSTKGVKRSETAGQFLMAGALVYIFAKFSFGEKWNILIPLLSAPILVGGIAVGFGRGLWISVFLACFIFVFFSKPTRYFKFLIFFIVAGMTSGIVTWTLKPDYVEAVVSRFTSVSQEVESGSSLGRRKEENYYAIERVYESPLIGVGLGGQYKPMGRESLTWENESRYIHNSYVRIMTKLGIPGLIIGIWLVFVFWRRTFLSFKNAESERAVAFSCFWIIVTTTFLTAGTQPNLAAQNGVATIAIALFISEKVKRKSSALAQEKKHE